MRTQLKAGGTQASRRRRDLTEWLVTAARFELPHAFGARVLRLAAGAVRRGGRLACGRRRNWPLS